MRAVFQLVIPFQLELHFEPAPESLSADRRSGRERRANARPEADRRRRG